jgi:hypothetical protein
MSCKNRELLTLLLMLATKGYKSSFSETDCCNLFVVKEL